MRVLTIANEKGGVGKSTTATAMADILSRCSKGKVLLIDTDPQRNSTDTMGAQIDNQATLYDVLIDDYPIKDAIQTVEWCDVLAGDPALKKAPKLLTGMTDFKKLRDALKSIQDQYEFVVIDTQPTANIVTQNALVASDDVIVPIQASRYSIQGLVDFKKSIDEIREVNPGLNIAGLLLTNVRSNTKVNTDVVELLPDLAASLGTKAFKATIRQSVAVQEAQINKSPIFAFAPKSPVAQDYIDLATEYLNGVINHVSE